jgi:hypothetical protein
MNSEAGDYIGQGIQQAFTTADGVFTAGRNFDNGVTIAFQGGNANWEAAFPAAGNAVLVPGSYENATRIPFQSPVNPGINISGWGRGCNTITGRFDVLEAVYGTGGKVLRFAADLRAALRRTRASAFRSGALSLDDRSAAGPAAARVVRLSRHVNRRPARAGRRAPDQCPEQERADRDARSGSSEQREWGHRPPMDQHVRPAGGEPVESAAAESESPRCGAGDALTCSAANVLLNIAAPQ